MLRSLAHFYLTADSFQVASIVLLVGACAFGILFCAAITIEEMARNRRHKRRFQRRRGRFAL